MDGGAANSSKVPYLGSKISIISKHEIRYEGILYTIDTQESTLALAKVRSMGTENRPTEYPIPPQSEIYEYIIFKASDIKDLAVCETPKPVQTGPTGLHFDPAISASGPVAQAGRESGESRSTTPAAGGVLGRPLTPGQKDDIWNNPPLQLAPGTGRPNRAPGVGRGSWSSQARQQAQEPAAGGATGRPQGYSQAAAAGLPRQNNAHPQQQFRGGGAGYYGVPHHGGGPVSQRGGAGGGQRGAFGGGGGDDYYSRNEERHHSGGASGGRGGAFGQQQGGRGGFNNGYGRQQPLFGGNDYGRVNNRGGGAFYQPRGGYGGYGPPRGRGGPMMNGYGAGGYGGYGGQGAYQYQRGGNFQRGGTFGRGGRPGYFASNQGTRGPAAGDKKDFEKDFDFDASNTKFEELEKEFSDAKITDDDDKEEGEAEDSEGSKAEEEGEGDAVTYYDNSKSFFDSISCEALEKEKSAGGNRNNSYQNRQNERQLNQQTFGTSGFRRGYGGYRGGRGRSNYYNVRAR